MFKKHKYVLVVEDSPDDQLLLTRSLSRSRATPDLLMLNDGQEVLNYIGREGRKPDLILLDIKIPKYDGLQVLKAIKDSEYYKNVPVIIMTTSTMRRDINQAYSSGASSYLVKHTSFSEWNKELSKTLDYWLNINITESSNDVA